eukprot:5074988-Pleurochrysis_carterae.AAC.2
MASRPSVHDRTVALRSLGFVTRLTAPKHRRVACIGEEVSSSAQDALHASGGHVWQPHIPVAHRGCRNLLKYPIAINQRPPSLGNFQCETDRMQTRMQRTMKAGPARRRIGHCPQSNATSSVPAFVMHARGKQFREYVDHVVVRTNLAHLDVAMRHVLAYLEVASIDMPRALTRPSLFREFNDPRVVHIHRHRAHLFAPHLGQQAPKVDHLGSCVRRRHDLGLC